MKSTFLSIAIASFLLSGCAKKVEEFPLPASEIDAEYMESGEEADRFMSSPDSTDYQHNSNEFESNEKSAHYGTNVSSFDDSNCYGSDDIYTCYDPNNGNTYEVQRLGNITEVQGSNSSTGSTWSQTTETIGNTTYTTGYDKDGNQWNQTGERIGDTYYYDGTDSDGNSFSGTCDSYSGCTRY